MSILSEKSLPAGAKLLYQEITRLCNESETGSCNETNRYYAEMFGYCVRTIKRYMRKLEQIEAIRTYVKNKFHREIVIVLPRDTAVPPRDSLDTPQPPSINIYNNNKLATLTNYSAITEKANKLDREVVSSVVVSKKARKEKKYIKKKESERENFALTPPTSTKKFTPPLLQAVKKFFLIKGSTETEAELFFYYYDSKDWHVGKHKMKKWKSAAAGWITRNKSNPWQRNKSQTASSPCKNRLKNKAERSGYHNTKITVAKSRYMRTGNTAVLQSLVDENIIDSVDEILDEISRDNSTHDPVLLNYFDSGKEQYYAG